jgi:ubiquinone/menaquinone biosynthesis C-methylase UbiE
MDQQFFDFAAQANITKHLGGLEATDELIQLCHITRNTHILDVGCGVGQTPCYITKTIGAHVTGIDINPKMVERSCERAEREGVTHLIEFRVADAQDLPFDDNIFDAVITESVTAFPPDKQKAVTEYTRVSKPGGYVGLNESTWLKTPPPTEVQDWIKQEVGASVKPLTGEEWVGLLENAGLKIITSITRKIEAREETGGLIQRYSYSGMMRSLLNIGKMYLTNTDYRNFLKRVRKRGITPSNLTEYFGYGIYVGRKQEH